MLTPAFFDPADWLPVPLATWVVICKLGNVSVFCKAFVYLQVSTARGLLQMEPLLFLRGRYLFNREHQRRLPL